MPIYEYRCSKCGHELEVIQKVGEAALTTCPKCQQESLQKKISAVSFRLKGGGWYETDFKQDKKRNLADSGDSINASKTESGKSGKQSDDSAGGTGKSKNADGASTSKPAGGGNSSNSTA